MAGHAVEADEGRRGGAARGQWVVIRVQTDEGDGVGRRRLARAGDGEGPEGAARGVVLDGDGGVAGSQRGQKGGPLSRARAARLISKLSDAFWPSVGMAKWNW